MSGELSSPALDAPRDRLGRGLDDLRISVIDRCNFRCTFCMPGDREYHFLPRRELLSFEEITRLAGIFVRLGVRKIRLTGGEPLLRSEIEVLVEMLAAIPGVEDLALTTNGTLLAKKAAALERAGLDRVTVSVESLDDETFGRINGLGHRVEPVLLGIDEAIRVGLGPVKVNTVVIRGTNDDHQLVELARYFKERRAIVRFIEFMDVGTINEWRMDRVVPASEILERIDRELPIEPLERQRSNEVAQRYRYRDDGVELGVIASITQPFCRDCTRARLSSEGGLYTCLFADNGVDLKTPLRNGVSDDDLESILRRTWLGRDDRYSEVRSGLVRLGSAEPARRIEMFRIGG
jgi:cyclic pyranopterin phosphate synthase